MSVSLEQLEGKIVKRTITRGKRELTVNILITNDSREIIIRRENSTAINDDFINSFIDKPVRVIGVVDGTVFIAHEIEPI